MNIFEKVNNTDNVMMCAGGVWKTSEELIFNF